MALAVFLWVCVYKRDVSQEEQILFKDLQDNGKEQFKANPTTSS